MAAMVGKYAARKLLGSEMDKFRSKKVAGDDASLVLLARESAENTNRYTRTLISQRSQTAMAR